MAKGRSKGSKGSDNQPDSKENSETETLAEAGATEASSAASDSTTPGTEPEIIDAEIVADASDPGPDGTSEPVVGDTSATEKLFADEGDTTTSSGDTGSDHVDGTDAEPSGAEGDIVASTEGAETVTLSADPEPEPEPAKAEKAAPTSPPPPPAAEQSSGPGFMPLFLGGVVAVAIGYGATVFGLLPGAGGSDDQSEALAATIAAQEETLAALQAQSEALAAVQAQVSGMEETDLSPVASQIEGVAAQLSEAAAAIAALSDRVGVLEDRPVFTGDPTADAEAAAAAVDAMEGEMRAQAEAAEAEMAAIAAAAEAELAAMAEATAAAEAAAAAAQAEAAEAIAAAEAEAAMMAARAISETALEQIRAAMLGGGGFTDAVATLAAVTDVPEGLSAVADSGVPTLLNLQDDFGPAARAALPVALRETAGDSPGDRAMAFIMGQVGGRAVEPREGDDPDAILSRVGAALESGDLATVLAELDGFPEGARGEMAGWVAGVEARANALTALDMVTSALSAAN